MRFDIFVVLTSVFAAAAALVSPVPVSASHAADLGTRTSEAPGNLGEVPRRGGKPVLVLVSPPDDIHVNVGIRLFLCAPTLTGFTEYAACGCRTVVETGGMPLSPFSIR
ncbi:hypothetical protein CPB85DRAFT_1334237 [Mucidula mucida]|nr:hypothetical protein CPB85DRAFT_1334237 [Mucidula mucida]